MRTINVTGRGQIRVHPDVTRITIKLEGHYPEYAETIRMSSVETEELRMLLTPFGFERTDLKTLSFDVEPEYESYKENDEWKRKFIGYEFVHSLKVEFDSDNERLGKIMYALANCWLNPEFQISYTVKDPEAVRTALIGKAVEDAVAKAGILSSAAGLKLGEIQHIDYSWGRVEFEVRTTNRNLGPCCSEDYEMSSIEIEPDDIEAGDTVTVCWEIV